MTSEEVQRSFAEYHLDAACNSLIWAMRCLQNTSYWEEHSNETVTLKAMYNSVVDVLRNVREDNERWNA